MRTIFVFKGLPGSGKSYEAIKLLREHPDQYKRVNKDSIRSMLIGPHVSFQTENMVVNFRNHILEFLLNKGYDVIVDDTNLREKYYMEICDIARKVGNVQVIERYIECPLETCLERNKKREAVVPEELIINMYKKYIEGKTIPQRMAYFPPIQRTYTFDSKIPNAIIADIDGTLAINVSGRSAYDATRVLEDAVNKPIANIVRAYHKLGNIVIIVSGREELAKADTETWLKCNDIPYDFIYTRKTGDSRKDVIIKKEIFEDNIQGKYNILFVLDDRDQTVAGWRDNLGLTCLQVAPGNF